MGPAVSAQNSVHAMLSEASSHTWAILSPKSKSTRNLQKKMRNFNRSLSFPSRHCRTGLRPMLSRPTYMYIIIYIGVYINALKIRYIMQCAGSSWAD